MMTPRRRILAWRVSVPACFASEDDHRKAGRAIVNAITYDSASPNPAVSQAARAASSR